MFKKMVFFVALPCDSNSTFVKNSPLIPLNSVPLRTSFNFGRHEGKFQSSFLPVQDPFSPGTRKNFQHNFSVPFDLFFWPKLSASLWPSKTKSTVPKRRSNFFVSPTHYKSRIAVLMSQQSQENGNDPVFQRSSPWSVPWKHISHKLNKLKLAQAR